MVDVCMNELSLNGQYTSVDECIQKGVFPVIEVLRCMEQASWQLHKSRSLYLQIVTSSGVTLYDVLVGHKTRQKDEIRRFKLLLSKILSDPYWEESPLHSSLTDYRHGNDSVVNTSLAEACERDKFLLSFWHTNYLSSEILIQKNDISVILHNCYDIDSYYDVLKLRRTLSIEESIKCMFRNTKLDFSSIDHDNGFNLIELQDESLFIDAFRVFTESSWVDIYRSDGLDYKEFTNRQKNKISIFRSKKIHKFRITQKYRCFGEVINGVFHVLMFDLTHKLSD